MLSSKIHWLLIGLLVVSTAFYVVGINIERNSGENQESTGVLQTPPAERVGQNALEATRLPAEGEEGHSEANETNGEHAATAVSPEAEAGHNEAAETAGALAAENQSEAGHSETILGVNLENPSFIAANIVLALALICLMLAAPKVALPLMIIYALAAFVLDILEVTTQISRSSPGIAGVAVLVALLHLALGVAACVAWTRSRTPTPRLSS